LAAGTPVKTAGPASEHPAGRGPSKKERNAARSFGVRATRRRFGFRTRAHLVGWIVSTAHTGVDSPALRQARPWQKSKAATGRAHSKRAVPSRVLTLRRPIISRA